MGTYREQIYYVGRLRSPVVDVRSWVLWGGSVDRARFWPCPYVMWWTVPLEQVCLQVLRFSHGAIPPVMCQSVTDATTLANNVIKSYIENNLPGVA